MINLKRGTVDPRKLKTRTMSLFQKGFFMLLLLVGVVVSAQQNITGTITDEAGVPLPGVNVVIKGTNDGVSSDFDGNYTIKAEADDVIVFSFIGFVDQEVSVGNNSNINVLLVASFDELDEVIVTTGYGQSRKRDLTGAIAQIRTETITRANPLQAAASLQGQVAGVNITKVKGRPGDGFDINIRGLNNFDADKTAPLVVVDGIMGANLNSINPSDIQTIDVLKDASSTAVYGSRGANGVIIVTTKKGATGKANVTYNGYYGIRTKSHMPEFMDSKQYYDLYSNEKFGRGFTAQEEYNVNNGITTDWVDLITQDAVQQNHTVAVSGGSEKTSYNFSAAYLEEGGLTNHTDYERLSLNAGVESQISDNVKVGFTSYITQSDRNWGSTEALRSALRSRPTGTVFFDDIVEPNKRDTNYGPVGPYAFFMGIDDSQVINPLIEIDPQNFQRRQKANSILANVFAEIKLADGLKFKTSYSAYETTAREGDYRGTFTKSQKGSNNPKVDTWNYKTSNYTLDNTLNYNKTFGKHRIDATALFSIFEQYDEYMQIQVEDLAYRSLWHNTGSGATIKAYNTNLIESSLASYMGRVNYTFNDKYLLTVTGRYDGASQLATDNKWAFFPSAALGWRLSEESFIEDLDVFSSLKLRVSYGEVGNNASISPYATQSNIYQTVYDFDGSAANGYSINSLSNRGLVWERSREVNFGLDFALKNIGIRGSIEIYKRNTEDLILDDKLPTSTGFDSAIANVGEIENSGVEITLNTVNVSKGDFKWSSDLTFTANKDKVIKLAGGITEDKGNGRFVGESVRAYYTYKFEGIWQTDEATEAAVYGQVPGQVKLADLNDDDKINSDDRTIVGKGTPDWTAGLRNQISYKNWDMSFFMYTRRGLMYSNAYLNATYGDISSDRYNRSSELNYWTATNPSNEYFSPLTGPGLNGNNESKGGNTRVALSYQMADFVRISDITFGYSLPQNILDELGVSRLRIYGQVQNPFVFSDFLSFDPEYNSGGDNDDLPAMTVLFGVNLNF